MFLLSQPRTEAQLNRGNDTSYYVFFPRSITARVFSSQKYTDFSLKSKNEKSLHYQPNTRFNFGIGLTYHNLSANLAYGFGFKEKKNNEKGKTKYLDLQAHLYGTKWLTEFYGQLYKGFHLVPEGFVAPMGAAYYYRPDIQVTLFGISRYRIFNSTRFSYRAAFLQNEWQKRSAGTFLLGAEAYYGVVRADSSFIPFQIELKYPQSGINKINYLSIGPGAGYAYTLVFFHHLFITGSITASLNGSYIAEHSGSEKDGHFSLNAVTHFAAAAGYNGRSWNVSANWVAGTLPFRGNEYPGRYTLSTGNYRIILAKRFMPGKKLQKHLKERIRFLRNEYNIKV